MSVYPHPKIALRCECGRRLADVKPSELRLGDKSTLRINVRVRPGHGDQETIQRFAAGRRHPSAKNLRWRLTCPRHAWRAYPLSQPTLTARVRRAIEHGRRELVLGVDL